MFRFLINHRYKVASTIVSTSSGLYYYNFINNNNSINNNKTILPNYTSSEIEKHNSIDSGIWATYKDSVYNITDFVNNHPGGKDKIMLCAGKSMDPYWTKYKQHTNDPNIFKTILSPMKIGTFSDYRQGNETK